MAFIAVSDFVRRQTSGSHFSHYEGAWSDLILMVEKGFHNATPGYRDGVLLVPVPPQGFYSNIVKMREGDILMGFYRPRKEGEEPRKDTFVLGAQKLPAQKVNIVLYRHDVLAENNEQSTDAVWEVISINAEVLDGDKPAPMSPGTLMANHFQESGGTATGMSSEEFANALAEARAYWNDKGHAAPKILVEAPPGSSLARQQMVADINKLYALLTEAVSRYTYYQDE